MLLHVNDRACIAAKMGETRDICVPRPKMINTQNVRARVYMPHSTALYEWLTNGTLFACALFLRI